MNKKILVLAVCLLPGMGFAGDRHLIELFTSQGCYSCPPAERLLGELIQSRSDVVALEFHVDYWDDLVYGSAGQWQDPFSDADHTRRQRAYQARGLEGNNGVYTPQAVVDGRTAVVGSDRASLIRLLDQEPPGTATVSVERLDGTLRIELSGSVSGRAEVWLYEFDDREVTRVLRGENKGKTLTNHHVVRAADELGNWQGGRKSFRGDAPAMASRGCAVVVQRPGPGEVLGAALCPG